MPRRTQPVIGQQSPLGGVVGGIPVAAFDQPPQVLIVIDDSIGPEELQHHGAAAGVTGAAGLGVVVGLGPERHSEVDGASGDGCKALPMAREDVPLASAARKFNEFVTGFFLDDRTAGISLARGNADLLVVGQFDAGDWMLLEKRCLYCLDVSHDGLICSPAAIMADDSLREKLDRLNEAVTDLCLGKVSGLDDEGNPVPASNDDLRVAMQLLKQNSISAAAIPDNPIDRMQKMLQGMRISPGHLEARQKALPHLLPALSADPASSTATHEAVER